MKAITMMVDLMIVLMFAMMPLVLLTIGVEYNKIVCLILAIGMQCVITIVLLNCYQEDDHKW